MALYYSMAWLRKQRETGGVETFNVNSSWEKDDLIIYQNDFFQANDNIPSGTPFLEGAAGLTWRRVSSETLITIDDYDPSKNYKQFEVISFNGGILRSKAAITAGTFNLNDWESVSGPLIAKNKGAAPDTTQNLAAGYDISSTWFTSAGQAFIKSAETSGNATWLPLGSAKVVSGQSSAPTAANDNSEGFSISSLWVTTDDVVYVMTDAGDGSGANAKWSAINVPLATIVKNYDAAATYTKDQLVFKDGAIIRAKVNVLPGTFDATKWDVAGTDVLLAKDHDPTLGYLAKQLTIKDGVLYRCKNDLAPKAWDAADWDKVAGESKLVAAEHDPASNYVKDELVVKDNLLRQAKNDLAPKAWDAVDWNTLGDFSKYRGLWSLLSAYEDGEIVVRNLRIYIANSSIAANTTFVEGNGANEWTEVSGQATIVAADWTSKDYKQHELVVEGGKLYRAKAAHTAKPSFELVDWDSLSVETATLVSDHDPAKPYVEDQLTIKDEILYRCKTDIAAKPFDEAEWEVVGGKFAPTAPDHDPSLAYGEDALVIRDKEIYRAKTTLVAKAWDKDDWELLSTTFNRVKLFSASADYVQNEVVVYSGVLYRALNDRPAAAWDRSDFASVNSERSYIFDHNSSLAYNVNQIVKYQGRVWRCVSFASGAWDESEWEILSSGTTWRDAWSLASTYAIGDVVVHNNRFWSANSDIAANTAFVEGGSVNEWTEISPPAAPKAPDWSSTSGYKQYEMVINGGKLYRSLNDHAAKASFDINDWEAISAEAVTVAANYSGVKNYAKHEIVYKDGSLWRAKAAKPGGVWDETLWDLISGTNKVFILNHSDATDYEQNEVVAYEGRFYRCNTTHTAKAWDDSDWDELSIAETFLFDHSDAKAYKEGNIVLESNKLYRCKADIAAKAFDAADWDVVAERSTFRGRHEEIARYERHDVVIYNDTLYTCKPIVGVGDGVNATPWDVNNWNELYPTSASSILLEHTLLPGANYAPDLKRKNVHVRMEITNSGNHQVDNPTNVFHGQRCTLTFRGTSSAVGRRVSFGNSWYDSNGDRLSWAVISGTDALSLDFVRDGSLMRCVTSPRRVHTDTPMQRTLTSQDLIIDSANGSTYNVDSLGNPYTQRYDSDGRAVLVVAPGSTLTPNLGAATNHTVRLVNGESVTINAPAGDGLNLFDIGRRYANVTFYLELNSTGDETSVTFADDYLNIDGTPVGKVAHSVVGGVRRNIVFYPEYNGTKTVFRATTQITSVAAVASEPYMLSWNQAATFPANTNINKGTASLIFSVTGAPPADLTDSDLSFTLNGQDITDDVTVTDADNFLLDINWMETGDVLVIK